MIRKQRVFAIVGLLLGMLGATPLSARSQGLPLTPQDIGDLGCGGPSLGAVAEGYLVGAAYNCNGAPNVWSWQATHAFRWSLATGMQDIGALHNEGHSGASGVNSRGEVVGSEWAEFVQGEMSSHNWYWSTATGMVDLGAGYGIKINERGVVAYLSGPFEHPHLIRQDMRGGGAPQDLGELLNNYGNLALVAINASGDIIGNYYTPDFGGNTGYYAAGNGTSLVRVGAPPLEWGSSNGMAFTGISDNGDVVGTFDEATRLDCCGHNVGGGGVYGFKWTPSAGDFASHFVDLGWLFAPYWQAPEWWDYNGPHRVVPATGANAINSSGTIVGYAYSDPRVGAGGYDAFTYTGNGPLVKLQRLYDWAASQARGISDLGVVYGYADGCGCNFVIWENGIPREIRPDFAPNYPNGIVVGHTIGGGSSDRSGNAHVWVMGLAGGTGTPPDTQAPTVTTSGNLTVEATSAAGTAVTFAAATATDDVGVTSGPTCSAVSGSTFPIGTTTVTCSASDAAGNTGTASFTVKVQDTTAPIVTSLTPSSATLWPPNHQMVPISLNAVANDAVGVTSLRIVSVTSSEPDNGLGDGDTAGDIVITGALTVNLRAERSGKGNGRTYTITVEAKDAAGNASIRTTTVSVLKSQGGR